MRLDNGSFWAHSCGRDAGSLFDSRLQNYNYKES